MTISKDPGVGVVKILAVLMLVLAACAPQTAREGGKVFFLEPADRASVRSPVHVRMAAEKFTIEAAGTVKSGAGHLHIIVDGDCVAAGQVVPKDETHVHFGQGQTEADLELATGSHTLCLQAADGAHTALPGDGMTQKITITVE